MSKHEKTKRPGQIILGWWTRELGSRKTGEQKALSARLRRGDDVTVLCHKPVHQLAQALGLRDGTRIARLARVLAHVREDAKASLPRRLGVGDPPALSPLRFERLVQSSDEDVETAIRRALPTVRHSVNVAHLGAAILFWNDRTRTNWCFDYYRAVAPWDNQPEDVSQ